MGKVSTAKNGSASFVDCKHDPGPSRRRADRFGEAIVKRRDLVGAGAAGLGGLALTSLIPSIARADGTLVSPDPIVPRIEKGPVVVGLVDFSSPPVSSTQRPLRTAQLPVPRRGRHGSRVYACDTRGKLWLINTSDGSATLFLDLKKASARTSQRLASRWGCAASRFIPTSLCRADLATVSSTPCIPRRRPAGRRASPVLHGPVDAGRPS